MSSAITITTNSAHSPSFTSLHLRHSSFSNPSLALSTSQLILQPFFCFFYVTGFSLTSPGEPPMSEGVTSELYGGDQILPIVYAAGASLLQMQCAAEYCHEEGQCLMTTFLVACSEQGNRFTASTSHLPGDYFLNKFTCSIRAQN